MAGKYKYKTHYYSYVDNGLHMEDFIEKFEDDNDGFSLHNIGTGNSYTLLVFRKVKRETKLERILKK